jgi:hypothetical protein
MSRKNRSSKKVRSQKDFAAICLPWHGSVLPGLLCSAIQFYPKENPYRFFFIRFYLSISNFANLKLRRRIVEGKSLLYQFEIKGLKLEELKAVISGV